METNKTCLDYGMSQLETIDLNYLCGKKLMDEQ